MRRGIFPNPDSALIPGLFVRIHASIGAPVPKMLVEERAIGADQRGDFVLVVNDKNVVEYRPVKLGIADGPLRVIEEGIQPSDWVIVNGVQRARPGVAVNPQPAERAARNAKPNPPVLFPPSLPPSREHNAAMFSRFFIERPIFANVIAIVTMLLGAVSLFGLPIEQYPADHAADGARDGELSRRQRRGRRQHGRRADRAAGQRRARTCSTCRRPPPATAPTR